MRHIITLTLSIALGLHPTATVRTHHAACTVITGYWIRDTATGAVFYRDAGDLTQGEFVGFGGIWVIVRSVCGR